GGRGGRGGFGGGPGAPGGGAPGGGGGGGNAEPRPTGVALDPLHGLKDERKPLRSKLLAVPALRAKYQQYVKEMAEKGLDWAKLEPVVKQYVGLIEKEVESDTRKLSSTAAFKGGVFKDAAGGGPDGASLEAFIEQRRAYLLNHPEIKKLGGAE
ncbi:MAG TPA: CotH kinase family protein, partial [Tepidisphaeraceae bacterium]|nr:CotH kinase family protein [Tepidisphaeraceae bacterium]